MKRHPGRRPPSDRLWIELPPGKTNTALRTEAKRRGMTPRELARVILDLVCVHGLFEAVIDGDEV